MDAGVSFMVFAGPVVPVPVTAPLSTRLLSVEAWDGASSDRGAFTITFDSGVAVAPDPVDALLIVSPQLRVGCRISVVVTVGATPTVLCDGFITGTSTTVGQGAGKSTLSVRCEDMSWQLDREEKVRALPTDHEGQIRAVLASYAVRGLTRLPGTPVLSAPPVVTHFVPVQRGTDLAHLRKIASLHGYVSYAVPGRGPGLSSWYIGPRLRPGVPQPAITAARVASPNVRGDVTVVADGHGPVAIEGMFLDEITGTAQRVPPTIPLQPPLSLDPMWANGQVRSRFLTGNHGGAAETIMAAQGAVELASHAVRVSGTLDGASYGSVLRAGKLVGLRGTGPAHDGLWFVETVEHRLERGDWTQRFTLTREGVGATVAAVPA